MKLICVLLTLSCFCHLTSYSQKNTYTIWQNGGYGLIDENGKEIFPPIAVSAEEAQQELVITMDRTTYKYGLVSKKNEVILPSIYERITRFGSGFYLSQEYKYGYADNSGKVIFPVKYSRIEATSWNSLLVSPDSLYGIADTTGKEIIPVEYQLIATYCDPYIAQKKGKYGLLGKTGKVVLPFEYDEISRGSYSNTYIITVKGKTGVIDPNGKIIVPVEFDRISGEQNTVTFHPVFYVSKNGKQGFYSDNGKQHADALYDDVRSIQYDYALAQTGKKMCLLDSTGKIAIPYCEEIKVSADNDLFITKQNGLYGVRDINGKIIIPESYKEINGPDLDELFSTTVNKKFIYFDKKGKRTASPRLDTDSLTNKQKDYSYLTFKTFGIKNAGKWRILNIYSKKYLTGTFDSLYCQAYQSFVLPGQKEAVYGDYDFMERQLITISAYNSIEDAIYNIKDGKTGVINESGIQLIPMEYDFIGIFFNGRALSKKNNKYGYINTNNNVQIPFEFDWISGPLVFSGDTLITSNFLKASKNKKFGVIDSTGKTIIDFRYDEISDFTEDGYAIVKAGIKTGVIDRSGNYLVALQDLPLNNYTKGLGVVSLGGDPIIYVNSAGQDIWHNNSKTTSISIGFYQQSIPENIGLLKDLEHFQITFTDPDILGMSGVIKLPASVYQMNKLKTMDLNFKVACLSPEIRNLKNLRTLKISFLSGCNEIPKEIGELPLLDSLKINTYSYGYGEETLHPVLPKEIGHLSSLRFLDSYIPFQALPQQLKYLSIHTDTIRKEMIECVGMCTELEKLELDYYQKDDSLLGQFLGNIPRLKNLKRFVLITDYTAPTIYMVANAAAIDTLKLVDAYFQNYNAYDLFSEKQITYLSTEADTFYFPKLEHFHSRGQDSYYLPRGLDSCKKLKKLDLSLNPDAIWEEIEKKLLRFPFLESLQLTMEPYGRESIFLSEGFYKCMKSLASAGKLKNFVMATSLLDEGQTGELKKELPGLNISIIKPDPYN
jgi:hypothetical protein